MMWIGIRRKNHHPLFIGCYYGKQETRCNKEEITEEMRLLSEEIEELKHEGNILIFMDGNGKVGLLGEEKSRNGILLEEVFEAQDLTLMNKNKICTGKITRQNTKNANENSAIDFVVADKTIEEKIREMIIDEDQLLKIKGLNNTDHNTIIVKVQIDKIDRTKSEKSIHWRLGAPTECWQKFRNELRKLESEIPWSL